MLTAKEARAIADVKQRHLDFILEKVKLAAEKQLFEVIIRDQPYERWLYETPKKDSIVEQVVTELKNLGYTVSMHYVCLQFVDMGLKISW